MEPKRKSTHLTRRLLSMLLAAAMLGGLLALGNAIVPASASISKTGIDMKFYVPEAIYLFPTKGTAMKDFQYYVDCDTDGSITSANARPAGGKTNGTVYFSLTGATNIRIEPSAVDGLGQPSTEFSITPAAVTGASNTAGANNNITAGSLANAINQNTSDLICWKATYTYEGQSYTQYAYTYVYAPLCQESSMAGVNANTWYKNASSGIYVWGNLNITASIWVTGVHTVSNGSITNQTGTTFDADVQGVSYASPALPMDPNYGDHRATTTRWLSGTGSIGDWTAWSSGNAVTRYDAIQHCWNNGTNIGSYVHCPSGTGFRTIDGKNDTNLSAAYGTGSITIDDSRYDNFKQVPNLRIGADITGIGYYGGGDKTEFTRQFGITKTDTWNGGSKTNLHSYSSTTYDQDSPHRWWNHVDVSVEAGNFSIGSHFRAEKKTNSNQNNPRGQTADLYTRLHVDTVDKGALRTAIRNANKLSLRNGISGLTWASYQTALKNAYENLGNLKAAPNAGYVTTLNNQWSTLAASGYGTAYVDHINAATGDKIIAPTFPAASAEQLAYSVNDKVTATAFMSGFTTGDWVCAGYDLGDNGNATVVGQTASQLGVGASMKFDFYYYPKFTVKYVDSRNPGTTISTSGQVTYGTDGPTVAAAPTYTGYHMTGWRVSGSTDTGLNGTLVQPSGAIPNMLLSVPGQVTFTAEWEPNQYTLRYDLQEGNINGNPGPFLNPVTYDATGTNCANVPPGTPVRDGYGFQGWWTTTDGTASSGTQVVGSTVITSTYLTPATMAAYPTQTPTPIYAVWKPNKYTTYWLLQGGAFPAEAGITLDGYGGKKNEEQDYGEKYEIVKGTTVPPPIRDGYSFEGWWTEEYGGTRVHPGATLATSDTLNPFAMQYPMVGITSFYAQWLFNEDYSIIYVPDNDSHAFDIPKTVHAGDTLGVGNNMPANPTREGYAFDGWYTQVNGGGKKITAGLQIGAATLSADSMQDYTRPTYYYAKWVKNSYPLEFNMEGGNIYGNTTNPTATVLYGDSIVPPANNPTLEGHSFLGWFTAQVDGTQLDGTTTAVAGVLTNVNSTTQKTTFYAQWSPNNYTITFDSDGGSAIALSPYSVPYNQPTPVPEAPTKTGYNFGGWYTQQNGLGTVLSGTVKGNATYYAKWTPKSYTVYWDDGSTTTSNGATFGGAYSIPTPSSKEGYRFEGWFIESTFLTPVTAATAVADGNVTFYAKWTAKTYALAFDFQNGSPATSCTVTFGEKFEDATGWPGETGFTKAGYDFGGWFTATEGHGTKYEGGTPVPATLNENAPTQLYAYWKPVEGIPYYIEVYLAEADGDYNYATPTITDARTGRHNQAVSVGGDYYGNAAYVFDRDNPRNKTSGTVIKDGTTVRLALYYDRVQVSLNYDITVPAGTSSLGTVAPTGILASGRWGKTVTVAGEPTADYYTFVKWDSVSGVGASLSGTTVTLGKTDTVLKAKWTAMTNDVTANGNGAPAVPPVTLTFGETFPLLPGASAMNHDDADGTWVFTGWYYTGTDVQVKSGETVVDAKNFNKPLEAHYVRAYKVRFDAGEGATCLESGERYYNRTVLFDGNFTVPTADFGYENKFKGWFAPDDRQVTANTRVWALNGQGAKPGTPGVTAAGEYDLLVTARWEPTTVKPIDPPGPTLFYGDQQITLTYRKSKVIDLYQFGDGKDITWSGSNQYVTVDGNGKITSLRNFTKTGTAIIRANNGNGYIEFEVKVMPNFWQWLLIIFLFGWIWY